MFYTSTRRATFVGWRKARRAGTARLGTRGSAMPVHVFEKRSPRPPAVVLRPYASAAMNVTMTCGRQMEVSSSARSGREGEMVGDGRRHLHAGNETAAECNGNSVHAEGEKVWYLKAYEQRIILRNAQVMLASYGNAQAVRSQRTEITRRLRPRRVQKGYGATVQRLARRPPTRCSKSKS